MRHAVRRVLLLLMSGVCSLPVLAEESAYVIDKLLVGVHRERDLNSAIIKVLPTGTLLKVLERKDQLAQVKDQDNVVGWVDAAYLMKDPPAASLLTELKQEKQQLQERLHQLEVRANASGVPVETPSKLEALMSENTELKSQLSALKLKGTELEEQAKSRARDTGAEGSIGSELRKANHDLTEKVEDLLRRNRALESALGGTSAAEQVTQAARGLSVWSLLGLLVLTAVAFVGGMLFEDFQQRRRHGGFRL